MYKQRSVYYLAYLQYNATQFNSTTNYILQNDHVFDTTPLSEKLKTRTFMTGEFIAGLLD